MLSDIAKVCQPPLHSLHILYMHTVLMREISLTLCCMIKLALEAGIHEVF